jgi:ferrous iron transport protein B
VAAFFPENGQNVIFGLYLIGILAAILTGLVLKKTILLSASPLTVFELPPYQWPGFKTLCRITWHRSQSFVRKAGLIIIPVCAVMGLLGAVNIESTQDPYIARMGKTMTPLFAPMGIQEENWPATVGLLTGMLAKEVVVGTLNTLYSGNDLTITEARMSQSTMGNMVQKFGSQEAAFAYLLFVLLYFPCISVIAVMIKELNKKWALFSVVWTTGCAYTVAVLFYQIATFAAHPLNTILWIMGLTGVLGCGFWSIRFYYNMRVPALKKRSPLPTEICVVQ